MTVKSILPPARSAVRQDPADARDSRLDRVAMLDEEQRLMALHFLSGYSPPVFEVVLKAVEPYDGVSPAEDDAEPFCLSCDASIGIFEIDNAWWHHTNDSATGRPVPYEADHQAVIGWREPTDIPPL